MNQLSFEENKDEWYSLCLMMLSAISNGCNRLTAELPEFMFHTVIYLFTIHQHSIL